MHSRNSISYQWHKNIYEPIWPSSSTLIPLCSTFFPGVGSMEIWKHVCNYDQTLKIQPETLNQNWWNKLKQIPSQIWFLDYERWGLVLFYHSPSSVPPVLYIIQSKKCTWVLQHLTWPQGSRCQRLLTLSITHQWIMAKIMLNKV